MNTKSILLVEDNPDDEELTLLAFQKNHFTNTIIVAHDGEEALEILFGEGAQNRPLPFLILLDLKLPKVDGLEVLKRIRRHERTKFLPVVVLTSSKEEKDLIASYSLGCNSYVRKRVSFPDFIEATRQLNLYWLLLNEHPPSYGMR